MAKNNKTGFFYVLYSDKTRVFDQSERAYYPIYIIIGKYNQSRNRSVFENSATGSVWESYTPFYQFLLQWLLLHLSAVSAHKRG